MPQYRVVGPHAVRGVAPGGTFDAELSEFQEWSLTVSGHIVRLPAGRRTHRFRVGEFTEESISEEEEE